MGWSENYTLKQPFTIEVNHNAFYTRMAELLAEDLADEVDIEEVECDEVDGEYARMWGSYTCEARSWHSPQTLYSPEEFEVERDTLEHPVTDKNLKKCLLEHAEELIDLLKVELTEDENEAFVDD